MLSDYDFDPFPNYTGAPLPPPQPSAPNPDYVQCPYCQRRFQEAAAERHIPFCKEQSSRIERKAPSTKAKDVYNKRMQVRHTRAECCNGSVNWDTIAHLYIINMYRGPGDWNLSCAYTKCVVILVRIALNLRGSKFLQIAIFEDFAEIISWIRCCLSNMHCSITLILLSLQL